MGRGLHPDGVFSARGTSYRGSDELRGYIRALVTNESNVPHAQTQHWNANISLREDGDEVSGGCVLLRVGKNKETSALEVIALGRYTDRIVRLHGQWLFAERAAEIF